MCDHKWEVERESVYGTLYRCVFICRCSLWVGSDFVYFEK